MLHRVDSKKLAHSFASSTLPVLKIEPGDEVIFETVDARGGRAMQPADEYVTPAPPPLRKANPVTGPVAIKGAEKGDTLVVLIEEIKLGAKGYSSVRNDMGVLQKMVKQSAVRVIEVKNNKVLFDVMRIDTRPMVGTIGVAPSSGRIATINPGAHGGNLDCNDISPGSRVFFPVNVRGALLSLGDIHATMGDGEVSGGGLDICADVRVKVKLLKRVTIDYPLVQTKSSIVVLNDANNIEEAIEGLVKKSVSLLTRKLGTSFEDSYRITSIVGDVRLCQACVSSINVVVRMQLPLLFGLL